MKGNNQIWLTIQQIQAFISQCKRTQWVRCWVSFEPKKLVPELHGNISLMFDHWVDLVVHLLLLKFSLQLLASSHLTWKKISIKYCQKCWWLDLNFRPQVWKWPFCHLFHSQCKTIFSNYYQKLYYLEDW